MKTSCGRESGVSPVAVVQTSDGVPTIQADVRGAGAGTEAGVGSEGATGAGVGAAGATGDAG